MSRILQFFLLIFHLGIVLMYNIGSSCSTYQDMYGKPAFWRVLSPILFCLDQFDHSTALETYARLSGMKCGYGFFSPNVGSPCFLQITLKHTDGSEQVIDQRQALRSLQGRIRYHNFLTRFRGLLPSHSATSTKENGQQRVIRALATSAGLRTAAQEHAHLACIRIYIYRNALLHTHQSLKAGYINLYEKKFF
ncbi:hypothetical protein SAMN05216436_105238 [bacterium A37T11]|nr:hypothetical protein SAMN05216436_105238 [bacterium A37T11]